MAPKKEKPKTATEKPLQDVWVVLLCGLPGSGKSTLRARLVKNGWAYVCQDEMGSTDACEKALVKALKNQTSCIVDRCNVTSSERRLWMQYANQAVEKNVVKGVRVHFEAIWMATPPDVCKERVRSRKGHETLGPDNADEVIDQFCKGLRTPERTGQEPYECVQFVATKDDEDIVVKRYADPSRPDVETKASAAAPSLVATAPLPDASVAAAAAAAAEIFILRHGERADRAKDRDGGWVDDPPLTKDGREMAKRAGAALRSLSSLPWAAVYSSPFYRCLQTANEAAAELGLPIRVEPGLSELCNERVFGEAPRLRPPAESLQASLTRAEADLSCAPHQSSLPSWPEEMRDANNRVLETSKVLAARHPGKAILLVCHQHSLVELTRHLPKSGGGAVGATSGYCAVSHITPSGQLLRCLDQSFLKLADATGGSRANFVASAEVGRWEHGWRWAAGHTDQDQVDPVDILFDMGLDSVLDQYPSFKLIFEKGTRGQQSKWREGWLCRNDEVRNKLQKACDANIFGPTSQAAPAQPGNLFPGPEDLATDDGDGAFDEAFHTTHSKLKFPSTAHLTNLGAATRDDKLCDSTRQRLFCGGSRLVSVEEKIDGANLGISIDSKYQFRLQARSKMISWTSDVQWAGLKEWLEKHRSSLCQLLERNNDILFGEWCACTHTVKYTGLPGYFLAFDIYDKRRHAFLSRASFHTRLQRVPDEKIPVVPMVCPPCTFASIHEVVKLLDRRSHFGDGFLEGVYLRIDAAPSDCSGQETYLEDRCKLVRSEFQQAIEEGGTWRGSGRNELSMDLAFSYVDECYSCAASYAATSTATCSAASNGMSFACDATSSESKYPSTPHLPFSPGVNSDDVMLADCMDILRKEVVVTEKFDGGNCCIKDGQVYARTHSQPATHESFSAVKQLSRSFAAQLGNVELFGENMFATHSINYNNLTSFFYVFAARADGQWFGWDEVVALAESLDLPTVPVVFRGRFESPAQLQRSLEKWAQRPSTIGADVNPEGFVLRRTHAFPCSAFADNMAKYVRANHIQTDTDWKRTWHKARLGPPLPQTNHLEVVVDERAEGTLNIESCTYSSDACATPAPQSLQRAESQTLSQAFSLWLRTALLEELSPDDAEPIIDCVEVILLGAASDPEALENAAEVLINSGATLCAAALPKQWHDRS